MMNEFDIIAKYFAPLTRERVALDNDAAVLDIPAGKELVVTSDILNAGVHFMADALPADIARKALRANVSDLYAMGAEPLSYQLNIAFPEKPSEEWLAEFSATLLADQKEFDIFCSGGDTTSIDGPLSISITALGLVDKGQAWTRSGAQEGDQVVLTGSVGDAWIGLQILRGDLQSEDDAYFVRAYYRPEIRKIDGTVHAAIDVSDGMVADLGHICKASRIGARVVLSDIPFSPQAQKLIDAGLVTRAQLLTGGDDYVLVMAVSPGQVIDGGRVIGVFAGDVLEVLDEEGRIVPFKHTGWSHF